DRPHAVGKARFLQGPAHPHVAHEALCKGRHPAECMDRDHVSSPLFCAIASAYAASRSMHSFQPLTWLSRIATLTKGVWWKLWTVRPSRSLNSTVTSVSTSGCSVPSSHLKEKTILRSRSISRNTPLIQFSP